MQRNMLLCKKCDIQGRFMKNLLFYILLFTLFQSCDDGDVIVTTFDFEEADLQLCGDGNEYVFYKINNEVSESLSLQLTTTDSLFLEDGTETYTLDGTGNVVNYRRFSSNVTGDYFCNPIPPTAPTVNIDYVGASGTATLNTTVFRDDNDGLGDETGDTDGDGIPDRYDDDDDGDNVPTAAELDTQDEDGDGDPLTNPLDTDGDEIPNYLDPDDDGDDIPTIYEDRNMNLDPQDDLNGTGENQGVPDYLNNQVAEEFIIEEFRVHSYSINSDVVIRLSNIVLVNGEETIIRENLSLGEIEDVLTGEATPTPDFVAPDAPDED